MRWLRAPWIQTSALVLYSAALQWLTVAASPLHAATPESIARGQQLFTTEFSATPLSESGDGLGPLFNHTSCVACHHAGGVGGAGDVRFNARVLAISRMQFVRQGDANLFATVQNLHPGFIVGDTIVNTLPIHRFGGSEAFQDFRNKLLSLANKDWSNVASMRSDAILQERSAHHVTDSSRSLQATVHVNSRNTTSLFGAGFIDQIPDSVITEQAVAQNRHPEIHGRPATLVDGRYGKFGWRANFATLDEFNASACANELGLQSREFSQASDATMPAYRNAHADISREDVLALTSFIAALPAPSIEPPLDQEHAQQIATGEQRFHAVGCAVCHVPNLGPVKAIYSDLLLHDMGPESTDYNPAPPLRRYVEETEVPNLPPRVDAYYGEVFSMQFNGTTVSAGYGLNGFNFETPTRPSPLIVERSRLATIAISSSKNALPPPETNPRLQTNPLQVGKSLDGLSKNSADTVQLRQGMLGVVSHTLPTNFLQEWRTPPLWGLRDSAPYMHDGRAESVLEAIAMHGGEAEKTRNRFLALTYADQIAVLAFLDTFVAPRSGVIPAPRDFSHRHLSLRQQ